MLSKKNILGVTLMELLVVISIITIVSIISATSFSSSQDSIMSKSAIENLMIAVNEAKTKVLTEQLKSSEFVFSVNNPRLFYYYNIYNLSELSQTDLASDFYIDHSQLQQATKETKGSAVLKWKNPLNGRLNLKIMDKDKIIENICILDTINSFDPDCASSNTFSLSKLNESPSYEFYTQNMINKNIGSNIILNYWLPINLRSDDNSMRIDKIELQDFNNQWIEVETASLKIQNPFTSKKYYVGVPSDKNRIEYQKLRLTFNKKGNVIIHEL